MDSALTARDLLQKLEHRRLLERLPTDRVLPEIKVEFSDVADYREARNLHRGARFQGLPALEALRLPGRGP